MYRSSTTISLVGAILLAGVVVLLSSYPVSVEAKTPEYWFTPDVNSPDMATLFTNPEKWPNSRGIIKRFKFYMQQLTEDCPASACGNNTLPGFLRIGAFKRFAEWGMPVGIEMGAVKDWDCTAEKNGAAIGPFVEKMHSLGLNITFVDLDEPFFAGRQWCKMNPAQVAKAMKDNYWSKVPHGVAIGGLMPYPAFSAAQCIENLKAMAAEGIKYEWLHFDVDFNGVRNRDQAVRDLQQIAAYCEQNGIQIGATMTGTNPRAKTDQVSSPSLSITRLVPHLLIHLVTVSIGLH